MSCETRGGGKDVSNYSLSGENFSALDSARYRRRVAGRAPVARRRGRAGLRVVALCDPRNAVLVD